MVKSIEDEDGKWCIDLDNLCLANDNDAKLLLTDRAGGDVETPPAAPAAPPPRKDAVAVDKAAAPKKEEPKAEKERRTPEKSVSRRGSSNSGKGRKKGITATEVLPAKKGKSYKLPFTLDFRKSETRAAKNDKERQGAAATVYDSDGSGGHRIIKADVFMISGCDDSQTSADVSNVNNFSLPNPNGKAGGACTSALLKVLYNSNGGSKYTGLTFAQVLRAMRRELRQGRYSQIPQLTSTRLLDVNEKFYIVPPNCKGTRRAVLIGINYTGQKGELSGCHNDCLNMKDYIMNKWGFHEENIVVLMDDGNHESPTRQNILDAYCAVARASTSGDAVFCHYSGHGGRIRDDDDGEEADGYDETLVPVDYASAGQIRDDDVYASLVCALASGVAMVALMDCCHSGTVLDLQYKYATTDTGSPYCDPLSMDGGNAVITCFICAIIICLCFVVPFTLT